jgi:hypothetical protein
MRKIKKIVSMLLTAVMLLSIVVVGTFSAEATSKTRDEAVAWVNSQIGKCLDYDGAYGAQCVDLIAYYYQFLGATTPGGNACDYTTNTLPSGWQRITNYSGFTPHVECVVLMSRA